MKKAETENSGPISDYRLDVSALLDLELRPECLPGIEASTELLRLHARKLEAFVYPTIADADLEPES